MSVRRIIALTAVLCLISTAAFAVKQSFNTDPIFVDPNPKDPRPDHPLPPPTPIDDDEVYADEGGEAPTAPTADEGGEAFDGTYADEGGEAPTAPYAEEGESADYAPIGDTASDADMADTAGSADFADDVVDCGGGPWFGGACGPMVATGPVGIQGPPEALLDVHGEVRFDTLWVDANQHVGVRATPGDEALRVGGILSAHSFDTGRPRVRTTTVSPLTCRSSWQGGSDAVWDATGTMTGTYGRFLCPVPISGPAYIESGECGMQVGSLILRARPFGWTNGFVLARYEGNFSGDPSGRFIDHGEVVYAELNLRERSGLPSVFDGCTITWTPED